MTCPTHELMFSIERIESRPAKVGNDNTCDFGRVIVPRRDRNRAREISGKDGELGKGLP
jgi:hypothetical protein